MPDFRSAGLVHDTPPAVPAELSYNPPIVHP